MTRPTFALLAALAVSFSAGADERACEDGAAVYLSAEGLENDRIDVRLDPSGAAVLDLTLRVCTNFDDGRMQGYSLTAQHDPSELTILDVTHEGNDFIDVGFTLTEAADNDSGAGFITVWVPGFDASVHPPNGDYAAAFVRYESAIVPTALSGVEGFSVTANIEFVDGLQGGGQPVSNAITHMGNTVAPCTFDFEVGLTLPPSAPFTRGDANFDQDLDISDPVTILRSQFHGDAPIHCFDAADSNDDGSIDISDASYLFNFLFLGGPPPPAPFPGEGHDETDDELDCRL